MPIFAAFAAVAPELLAVEAAATTAAEIAAAEAAAAAAAETAAQQAAQQAAAQTATSQAGIAGIPEPVFQSGQGLPSAQTSPVSGINTVPGFEGATSGPQGASPGFFNPSAAPGAGPLPNPAYQVPAPSANQGLKSGMGMETMRAPANAFAPEPPSSLMKGLDSATAWAKSNPFTAMTGAYMGANALGLMNPSGATFNDKNYNGPLSRYRLSDDFQAGSVNPEDFQYTPRRYAEGGVMGVEPYSIPVGYSEGSDVQGYAKGGSLSDSITQYQKMLDGKPQAAPAKSADVGIYYDQDPDTRYQDALTAAQIRQAKVNQRAYVSSPAAKRPSPMGQLQMASVKPKKQGGDDVEAAHGGIMHSSLGGYAAGGNPRLLKGPGDGMSDNIPATINGRQPARLADGEFVIPADVVSHMGNGSTEAGAKQLHAMMDKVRRARTGNPKQGKNINPKKYMPK